MKGTLSRGKPGTVNAPSELAVGNHLASARSIEGFIRNDRHDRASITEVEVFLGRTISAIPYTNEARFKMNAGQRRARGRVTGFHRTDVHSPMKIARDA